MFVNSQASNIAGINAWSELMYIVGCADIGKPLNPRPQSKQLG